MMNRWLSRAAALHPRRSAIELPSGEEISYARLLADASAAARWLAADGPAPGDRLPIDDGDRLKFAIQLHGALLAGVAAVPIDGRLSESERDRRRIAGQAPSDAATVMYTSGTTAGPKEVALSAANWEANAVGSALALGLDPRERWLCAMPLGHVGGLSILLRSAIYATTVVLHERFDVDAIVAELMDPERRVTLISVVPTMLGRLLDAGLKEPPTLRWALTSGAPIPPIMLARAAAAGVPVAPSYGLTETCSQMVTFGLPLFGGELRLVDGEIQVRGPMVAAGALGSDGWLATGDLGQLDERGRLSIVGRRSELIVSGGENIAPAEVEAVLLEHPALAEVAVFSRPDPDWGEAVAAAVVLRPQLAAGIDQTVLARELKELVSTRLAAFMAPKTVTIVPRLPRNVSGKLLRGELR